MSVCGKRWFECCIHEIHASACSSLNLICIERSTNNNFDESIHILLTNVPNNPGYVLKDMAVTQILYSLVHHTVMKTVLRRAGPETKDQVHNKPSINTDIQMTSLLEEEEEKEDQQLEHD